MNATIIEIRRADQTVNELVLSDGRTLKVWNYQAATALDLDEADGDVAVGSSLADEFKDDSGNTVYRFYSAKTMYVLASVGRRYPYDVDHAKELLALGWTTDISDEVDIDNYPPGEDRGPGGIRFDAGFCWRPPVEPQGKVTIKGDDTLLDSLVLAEHEKFEREQGGAGDPESFDPEPDLDDYHPRGPEFVSLDAEPGPPCYSGDRDDEENRYD